MERRNEQMLGRGRHGEPLQADVAAGGGMEENHVMTEFQTATAVRRFVDSVSASLDLRFLIAQLILAFRAFLASPLVRISVGRCMVMASMILTVGFTWS